MRKLAKDGAPLLLLSLIATTASAQEQIVLRFSQFTPRTHFYHSRILEPWAADVEKVTAGRVKIEFTTAPLGPFPRNFDMAATGVADVTAGNHGVTPGRFKVTQIVETPGLPETNPAAVSIALWRTHEKFLSKANEHNGTHVLSLHVSGAMHFFTQTKPIAAVGDFKGLKLIASDQVGARVAGNLGAVAVVKPVTDYYDTVSKGVVDGIMGTNTSVAGWRIEPFVKYQLSKAGGMMYGTFFVVVNKKKWDTLSTDDRDAVMQVSGEKYATRAGGVFTEQDTHALEERKKRGVEVTNVSSGPIYDAIVKSMDFIDPEWIKVANAVGVDGQAALDFFKAEVRKAKP